MIGYVLDEHFRGALWKAIKTNNARSCFPIDALRVGDAPDLPLGSQDPDILIWAEQQCRVLLTRDKKTMGTYVMQHLAGGRHTPGVFVLRPNVRLRDVVEYLALVAYASDPFEWKDLLTHIP